ncbi:MAG: SGNH/GDSL hydrolase family protein [Vicinamibacterales bacterium]
MNRPLTLKRVAFAVVANLLAFSVLSAIGELATRWYMEGSVSAALRSFVTSQASDDATRVSGWLVSDADLGYKLNPASAGVNSLGIRHDEIADVKPDGLFRVIVLGDSVAWGEDGFVKLLRDRFNRVHYGPVEVINAAIPGYTTYQERTLLERDLLRHRPDLVILQYCLNDHHRFLHMLNETGRWLVTPDAERVLVPQGQGPLTTLMRSSYLLLELRLRLFALMPRSVTQFPWETDHNVAPAWQDHTWSDFEAHVQAMRDSLARLDARFAVVAVPLESQLQQTFLDRDADYTLKPQRTLAEICRRLSVPFLDLHPVFVSNRKLSLYKDGLHLKPAGHELMAEHILAFLERDKLAN